MKRILDKQFFLPIVPVSNYSLAIRDDGQMFRIYDSFDPAKYKDCNFTIHKKEDKNPLYFDIDGQLLPQFFGLSRLY